MNHNKFVFSSKEISQLTGIKLTKVRHYVNNVLKSDPIASQHSGKKRLHSFNEILLIYITNFLVTEYRFLVKEVKAILSDMDQWLCTEETDNTEVFIVKAKTVSGFHCIAVSRGEGTGEITKNVNLLCTPLVVFILPVCVLKKKLTHMLKFS